MIKKQSGVLLVLVLCTLLIERVGWLGHLQERIVGLLQPVEYFGIRTAQLLELPFFVAEQKHATAVELQKLKRSYAMSLAKLSELERVQQENEALRALIASASAQKEKKRLTAPVLSYALTAVAMGSDDGVEVGNLVYISDVLVGRIVSVSRTQSQVALFSTRDAEPVLVQTASGAQGLLVGNGTRTLLTQIPVQVSITTGERLTTVGQQGIPPGQFIGVVASVSAPGTAPMQTALIDQLQSFYTVPLVEIR
jgi:cell shape-determining protein MreC